MIQGAKVVEISLLEGELDPRDGIVELVTHGMVREGTSSHAIVTRARHKVMLWNTQRLISSKPRDA